MSDNDLNELISFKESLQTSLGQLAALGQPGTFAAPAPAAPEPAAESNPQVGRAPKRMANPALLPTDPSLADYKELDGAMMAELEAALPGVTDRMNRAMTWEMKMDAAVEAKKAKVAAEAHAEELRTNPEALKAEIQRRGIEKFHDSYKFQTPDEREQTRQDLGLDDKQYQEIKDRVAADLRRNEILGGRI